MMTLRDSLTLAITKLRTRPVRLVITLIISGLLFSVLILMSLTIRGTLASLGSFTKEGYFSRFIVSVNQAGVYEAMNGVYQDPALIKEATARFNTLKKQKATEAKRLGIAYDPAQEAPVATDSVDAKGGAAIKVLVPEQPVVRQLLTEKLSAKDQIAAYEALADTYNATALYRSYRFDQSSYMPGATQSYTLSPLVAGKEQEQATAINGMPNPIDSFSTLFASYSAKMIEPMVFEGLTLEAKAGEPIPVIAPLDAAEKLTGLTAPSAKASPRERLNHVAAVRQKARNFSFQVCYRNGAAAELTAAAKSQIQDIKLHQKDAGFQMPSQVYAMPSTPCAPPVVTKDTRSTDEKLLAQKQAEFDAKFGKAAPQTSLINFRIVGLSPKTPSFDGALSLQGLFSSVLSAGSISGWLAPIEAINVSPQLAAIQNDAFTQVTTPATVYLEMPNRDAQRRLTDEKNCNRGECTKKTDWYIMPTGNPLATIYDGTKGFNSFLNVLLAIIAVISALIMMGTIGKVIADSRRETSVFRALGARRLQIIQLYSLYAACLGALTFTVAAAIGLVAGAIIDARVSPDLSVNAVIAFNASDLAKPFHVIGLNLRDLAGVALVTLATALLSAAVPLSVALRRDPVKDMRDDT